MPENDPSVWFELKVFLGTAVVSVLVFSLAFGLVGLLAKTQERTVQFVNRLRQRK